jgi:hypothetical protein
VGLFLVGLTLLSSKFIENDYMLLYNEKYLNLFTILIEETKTTKMKEVIKKYIGIVGFIVGIIMVFIAAYNEYFYGNDYEKIGLIGVFLWATTSTIAYELNKPKPKIWFIYFVIITSIFLTFIYLK